MQMYNPPHPGEVIWELCLEPLALSIIQTAEILDVSEETLAELLNGHLGISAEMAIRLSLAFDTTPESWLWMQMQYDLWQIRQHTQHFKVRCIQGDSVLRVSEQQRDEEKPISK